MSPDRTHQDQREMAVYEEPVRAHLSLDPWWDRLTVIRFGSVWDGQPEGCFGQLVSDERLVFLFEEPGGPVIGFMVGEPHEFDPEEISDPTVWEGARFEVPLLGLTHATVGEIVLAVHGRFADGEPTNDAMFFHMAIDAAHGEGDLEKAAWCWRMALEAGDQKGALWARLHANRAGGRRAQVSRPSRFPLAFPGV
jgi:hypothetical protein